MFADCFWRGRVGTDQRWDEGVGAGGGRLGSIARARRSLAAASPARVLSLPWGRGMKLRKTGGGSRSEERHGLAAAILRIDRRQTNPVRGTLG
jgi:hypothetical protein